MTLCARFFYKPITPEEAFEAFPPDLGKGNGVLFKCSLPELSGTKKPQSVIKNIIYGLQHTPPEFTPTIFPGRDGLYKECSLETRSRGSMPAARLSDVDAWRAAERPGPTRSRVVWGPVDAAAAASLVLG